MYRPFVYAMRWIGNLARVAGHAVRIARPVLTSNVSETNARLRAAMDELPEGVVLLDPEGRYIHWNKCYAEIYSRSADLFQVGAKMIDTLRIGVARGDYPAAKGREEAWLAERVKRLECAGERHEQQLSDGRWVMIEERRMADGCTIGIRVDVTDMKQREASFRLLFESNPVPMFVYDRETLAIMAANKAASDHYGYTEAELLSLGYRDICLEGTGIPGEHAHDDGIANAEKHRMADGSCADMTTYARHFSLHDRPAIIVSAVDMTERNRSEARIAHLARHDPLTGVPNRMAFREQLERLCLDMSRINSEFSLLLVDLDRFKGVNDLAGHGVGDRLLQCVADRLTESVSPQDVVARLGGDEFAILHPGNCDHAEVLAFANAILEGLRQATVIDGHELSIGASIGIARAPDDGKNPDELMRRADLALYAAKGSHKGEASLFVPELDFALNERRRLEADLRNAIANGEIEAHYQPIIDLASGRVECMEALARWIHPQRGLVSPADFIPLAEETGLICEIGQFILEKSCRDALNWPAHVKVAVNLSPVQFRRPNLLLQILTALQKTALPAQRLELEITEALLMDKSESTLQTLRTLREAGVGLSMDDFGTGFSSLSYLRTFPFTKIKIDRSFVTNISQDIDSQAIVRAIVGLGHSFNLTITAEGIESFDDMEFLRSAGCHQGQGYAIGRPAPLSILDLATRSLRSAA